jgi:hypothetical protein
MNNKNEKAENKTVRNKNWTQAAAIKLAKRVEEICPPFGCHVGLTGGCLYKQGKRKDCDLVIYRIRQVESIDIGGLLAALESIGVTIWKGFGFCYKCDYQGKNLDLLLPEEPGGDYQDEESTSEQDPCD